MPLLFIEVDNCHETAEELAAKLEKYARFFRRRVKDTDGRERPMWRTRWMASQDRHGDVPHPPVLLVFNHVGERNPNRTIPRLQERTRHLWQGEWQREGYHLYDGKIPIVAVGLRNLREHGPTGPVFFRFGRDRPQPLLEAIGNPRREAAHAREAEAARARETEYQTQLRKAAQEQAAKKAVEAAREAAQREARRPACAGCGSRFTDARWEAAEETDWGRPVDTHPTLCDTCKQHALAAAGQPADAHQSHGPDHHVQGERDFWRYPNRPVCAECRTPFTDDRWKAVNRTGWGPVRMEPRPTLCGDCDQQYVTDIRQAWPGTTHQEPEQDQEQTLPEQKAGGTCLSRFRR
ncbi:hypothetical protein ACIQRK_36815 [Streptomyces anulatus]